MASIHDLPPEAASADWHVAVQHARATRPTRPSIGGEVTYEPAQKDLPVIEVPVPPDDRWLDRGFEAAPMAAWASGERLPIEQLVDVRVQADHYTLVGKGGVALEDHTELEVRSHAAHDTAGELIDERTPYGIDVDDPSETITTNHRLQSVASAPQFRDVLTAADDDPIVVHDQGRVEPAPICWPMEGEHEVARRGSPEDRHDASASGGEYIELDTGTSGAYAEWIFECFHDIPISDFRLHYRTRHDAAGATGLMATLDGSPIGQVQPLDEPDWTWETNSPSTTGWERTGDVRAGRHTLRIETESTNTETVDIDLVAPHDSRYGVDFDNSVGSHGYLSAPQTRPDAYTVTFAPAPSPWNVPAGRVEASISDISGDQRIALSNDQANWVGANNTEAFETGFSGDGSSLSLRVTLDRHGQRVDATPTRGFNAQNLWEYDLFGDLDATPVLTNAAYSGSIRSVLNDIAQDSNGIWGVTVDDSRRADPGDLEIVWTQPGTRTDDIDPPLAGHDLTKHSGPEHVADHLLVVGGAQPQRDESWDANHGVWVDLANDRLVTGKETVHDGSGTTYQRTVDYELNHQAGEIRSLSGGSLTDGSTYRIDYEYKASGEFPSDPPDDAHTRELSAPNITTDEMCAFAATHLGRELNTPSIEGTITIAPEHATFSLVESLAIDGIPFDERLDVVGVAQSQDGIDFDVNSRQDLGAALSRLDRRVDAVNTRV